MLGIFKNKTFKIDGTFIDSVNEKNYLEKEWHQFAVRTRHVTLATALLYIVSLFLDISYFDSIDEAIPLLYLRSLVVLFALVLFFVTYTKFKDKGVHVGAMIYVLSMALTESFELYYKPELVGQQVPFLVFIIFLYGIVFRAHPSRVLITGFISVTVYCIVLFVLLNANIVMTYGAVSSLIISYFVSLYLSYYMNRIGRIEYADKIKLEDINRKLQNEIHERIEAEIRLKELAITDELTGLNNRRFFIDQSKKSIATAERNKQPLSLLFMDIDYFKNINDSYGHSVGDLVLRELAEVCRNNLRINDLFSRYGGEEFAILAANTGVMNAYDLGEKIRKVIENLEIVSDKGIIRVTVSIGISCYDENISTTFDKMFLYADAALYEAKNDGRNQVVIYNRFISEKEMF